MTLPVFIFLCWNATQLCSRCVKCIEKTSSKAELPPCFKSSALWKHPLYGTKLYLCQFVSWIVTQHSVLNGLIVQRHRGGNRIQNLVKFVRPESRAWFTLKSIICPVHRMFGSWIVPHVQQISLNSIKCIVHSMWHCETINAWLKSVIALKMLELTKDINYKKHY